MKKEKKKEFKTFEYLRDALLYVVSNYEPSDKKLSALSDLIVYSMCKMDGDIIIWDELGLLDD